MLEADPETVDKFILYISFCLFVFCYTFWEPIRDYYDVSIFYVGTSLGTLGYTYVLWRKYRNVLTEIILAGTSNAAVDEIFFDPEKFQWNEYVMFSLIILIIIYNAQKRRSA